MSCKAHGILNSPNKNAALGLSMENFPTGNSPPNGCVLAWFLCPGAQQEPGKHIACFLLVSDCGSSCASFLCNTPDGCVDLHTYISMHTGCVPPVLISLKLLCLQVVYGLCQLCMSIIMHPKHANCQGQLLEHAPGY